MPHKRSILFMLLGIALGTLFTVLLFGAVQRCSEVPPAASNSQLKSKQQSSPKPVVQKFAAPEWEIASPKRDMHGDCNICGQIFSIDNTPIENALVRLRLLDEPWNTANINNTVQTDKNGKYCFKNLTSAAMYQLFSWKKAYAVASYEDVVCNAATDLYLDKGATLNLKIVDKKGYSVPFVEVHLAGSSLWPMRRALSDVRGQLTVHGLEEGLYSFRAIKNELSFSLLEPVALSPGEEIELEVQLHQVLPIQVSVLDATSKMAISKAIVTAVAQNESLLTHTFITNKNGETTITAPSVAGTQLTVFAPGYTQKSIENIHPAARIEVFLSKGSTIKGTVQTPKGKPITDAQINARFLQGENTITIPGGKERNFIFKKASSEQVGWPQALDIDDQSCILGPTHIPLPKGNEQNANSSIIRSETLRAWGPTGENGEFTLDAIPNGGISLGATHPKYVVFRRPSINVTPGQAFEGIPIIMKPGASLSLRVVSRLGHPIENAAITVFDVDGQIIKSAETKPDGYTQIEGLPEQFRIEAVATLFIPAARKMFGPSGQIVDATIRLDDANKTLNGRVVNKVGTGIENATIEAELLDKGLAQVLTGESEEDGTFALEGAGDGKYVIRAKIAGDIRATATDVTASKTVNLVVTPKKEEIDNNGVNTLNQYHNKPDVSKSSQPAILHPPHSSFGGGDSLGVIGGVSTGRETVANTSPNETLPSEDNTAYITGASNSNYGEVDDLLVTGPPAGIGVVPIHVQRRNKGIVITKVQAGSQVAAAGLKVGAVLKKIDGRKVSGIAMANKELHGKIGSVVIIEVIQDGEQLSVVIQRERK